MFNAGFMVKMALKFWGSQGIHDCSPDGDGSVGCRDYDSSEHNHPARTCWQKCHTDGCNSASSLATGSKLMLTQ